MGSKKGKGAVEEKEPGVSKEMMIVGTLLVKELQIPGIATQITKQNKPSQKQSPRKKLTSDDSTVPGAVGQLEVVLDQRLVPVAQLGQPRLLHGVHFFQLGELLLDLLHHLQQA